MNDVNDLISRQAAIDAIGEEPLVWYDGEDEIAERNQWKRDIEAIKQLQPAEPNRGKWIYQTGMIKCDQCLRAIRRIDHDGLLNFCPNCGADMRGEQDG